MSLKRFVEQFKITAMFCECLHENLSSLRALLSIKPRKTIYHCKADKLKFAKISMFFYFFGYISAQRPVNSILAMCT